MALDRIEDISELNHAYKPSDIDWEYYLSDIIGVTRLKGDLQEVKLLFSTKRSKYIETKPLHESQRTTKTSDGLVVRLSLVPNPELEQVILSFGEDIQVLEPSSLVTRIKERIESMSGRYNN
jgi:predicted DNA-binding transcriptional regulator YafY